MNNGDSKDGCVMGAEGCVYVRLVRWAGVRCARTVGCLVVHGKCGVAAERVVQQMGVCSDGSAVRASGMRAGEG